MLVSYLPFRLAQKHYFQSVGDEGEDEQTRGATQSNMAFYTLNGAVPRAIGSGCNCCDSLQITARPFPPFPSRLSSSLQFTLH